jgi:hypothetical protein
MRTADAEGKRFSPPPEKYPAIWRFLDLSLSTRGGLPRHASPRAPARAA